MIAPFDGVAEKRGSPYGDRVEVPEWNQVEMLQARNSRRFGLLQ